MEVAEGHQHHLGRKIVFLEVGDKWDNREKIFRFRNIFTYITRKPNTNDSIDILFFLFCTLGIISKLLDLIVVKLFMFS